MNADLSGVLADAILAARAKAPAMTPASIRARPRPTTTPGFGVLVERVGDGVDGTTRPEKGR